MRRIKFFAVLFLVASMVFGSVGCGLVDKIANGDHGVEVTMTEAFHGVYQMNLDGTKIVKVSYEIETKTMKELIEGCIAALQAQPSDNAYKNVISGNVKVTGYEYDSTNRLVTLYFDPAYENLTPTNEILTRAAIVKTLTQFSEDIQYVSFVIGDEPLTEKDGSRLLMRGRDFVSSIGGSAEYVREDYVTMYFVNSDGTMLQAEDVIVKYSSTINLETAIVNSLISGPITMGLKPAVSSDVVVNKVNVKEGICYVDLDKTFLERVGGQSFKLNIYAVVNTLTQIAGITRVQFLIDGEIFEGKVEGFRIDGLFEKDMSIVYRPEKIRVPGNATTNSDLTKDIEHMIEGQKETESEILVEGYVPDTIKESESVLETENETGE